MFFNLPGAQGHLNPTLGVVQALVRRGETIVYYAGEKDRAAVEAAGAEFRSYAPYLDYTFNPADAKDLVLVGLKAADICDALYPGLFEEIRADPPDYVIYDSCCPWGKWGALSLKIPAISSVTSLITTPWVLLDSPVQALSMLKWLKYLPVAWPFWRKVKKLLAGLGLPNWSFFYIFFDILANLGELNIVYLAPEFQPFREKIKEKCVYVGASLALRPEPSDPSLGLDDASSLVYVSLGTLHNERPEFYRACIEAFSDGPSRVIMSIGQSLSPAALGSPPGNILIRPRVPQIEILKHARVFISHGGMNSINEALYFGVPLVLAPQTHEQAINAHRVAKLGAGVVLKKSDAKSIRAAVERLMAEPRFKENALALGRSLRQAGGAERAASEIMNFIEEKMGNGIQEEKITLKEATS